MKLTRDCPACLEGSNEGRHEICRSCDGSGQVPIDEQYIRRTLREARDLENDLLIAACRYSEITGAGRIDELGEIEEEDVTFIQDHGDYSLRIRVPLQFFMNDAFEDKLHKQHAERLEKEERERQQRLLQQEAYERKELKRLLMKHGDPTKSGRLIGILRVLHEEAQNEIARLKVLGCLPDGPAIRHWEGVMQQIDDALKG